MNNEIKGFISASQNNFNEILLNNQVYDHKNYLDNLNKNRRSQFTICDTSNHNSPEPNFKQFRVSVEPQKIRTSIEARLDDKFFNPITQKYTNSTFEKIIRQAEQNPNILAKAYDKALQKESKYNIIHHLSKLAPLQNTDINPRNEISSSLNQNQEYIKNQTRQNYNILSLKNFDSHFFDKIENTPIVPPIENKNHGKRIFKKIKNADFNVLTGEYNEFHSEKSAVDKQACILEASRLYNSKQKFDIFTQKHISNDQEKEFIEKENAILKAKQQKYFDCLPDKNKQRLISTNIINQIPYNEDEVAKQDKREANLKLRYKIKNDFIVYNAMKRNVEKSQKIIDKDPFEILKKKVNDNSKSLAVRSNLFKDRYDCNDVETDYNNYKGNKKRPMLAVDANEPTLVNTKNCRENKFKVYNMLPMTFCEMNSFNNSKEKGTKTINVKDDKLKQRYFENHKDISIQLTK